MMFNGSAFLIELFTHSVIVIAVLIYLGTTIDDQLIVSVAGIAFVISIVLKGKRLEKFYLQKEEKKK